MDSLSFHCGEKRLAEPRVAMQGLSWIKPEMMQQVLSSIGLPQERNSAEAPNRGDLRGSFPHNRTASNDTSFPHIVDSRSVSASISDKQSAPRLTIIYNGVVNVYHVSPEKAEAIMQLASTNSASKTTTPVVSSGSKEEVAKPCATSTQQIKKATQGLPIARKLSLQRFLEKRKDRISTVSPYTSASDQSTTSLKGSSGTMVKNEGLEEDPITLSLSFPSQRAC
ncbi:protein TIFY 9 [Cryptomeria japonica]|uniref:protein TIFY 9 n=1 Tax=Cryptomeria japonica TaxID=3369 RepID=UPI0025ABBCBD|nr:protein TIFY 9 [Cryptomeria japonica]